MISSLFLKNFKCFQELALPLGALTLLTGFNAAGKSTSLQNLLLLAQAQRSDSEALEVPLNGPLVELGTPGEVLSSHQSDSREIRLGVEDEQVRIDWILASGNRNEGNALRVGRVRVQTADGTSEYAGKDGLYRLLPVQAGASARALAERVRSLIYLSAVRRGAADVFPMPDASSPIFADVGLQGEFAPWWFEQYLDEDVEAERRHPDEPASMLRKQFNAWANELFPGAQGNAQKLPKTNLLRLELRIGDTDDWQRPANIGYGLTYAFPVLIASLLAKRDQILIVDSPEAHLHPMGQSLMGRFLARMAAAGVQVLIETHSDHVLNGVRLAVRDGLIPPDRVATHFFNAVHGVGDASGGRILSPLMDPEGNLSEWPVGFFDQAEKDLAKLAGWG